MGRRASGVRYHADGSRTVEFADSEAAGNGLDQEGPNPWHTI